jgi:hypothetical protein
LFQNVVKWRKGNKVLLSLNAILPARFEKPKTATKPIEEEEILTGFGVRFMYTNTVPALEQREIQKVDITVPIYVVLGKMTT